MTALRSASINRFNVRAFGAIGDGATDDTAAINAATVAAVAAGGTVVFPKATYALAGALTVGGTCGWDGCGSTLLRKAGNTTNGNLVTIPIGSSGVVMRDLIVDGGSVAVSGFATSILWLGPNGVAENVVAQNCAGSTGNGWAVKSTNFYGRNVRAVSVNNTGLGFYIAAADNMTFKDVYVEDCSYSGFHVPEAATRLTISGKSYRNNGTGLFIMGPASDVHVTSWESVEDNQFGAQLDGRPSSNAGIYRIRVDSFSAVRTGAAFTSPTVGAVAANNAGTGLEAYYMRDSILGSVEAVDVRGYALAMVACLRNSVGTVAAHGETAADGDPPVTLFASSSYNHFASIRTTGVGSTWALIIGEDSTDCAHNTVDIVSSRGCPFGCVLITGSYNHIGRVVSRDTFVYNDHGAIPSDSVVYIATATGNYNTIGFVDHKNIASPGASHTAPLYVVHTEAATAHNRVLGYYSRDFVTAGSLLSGTDNTAAVVA